MRRVSGDVASQPASCVTEAEVWLLLEASVYGLMVAEDGEGSKAVEGGQGATVECRDSYAGDISRELTTNAEERRGMYVVRRRAPSWDLRLLMRVDG